MPIAIKVGPPEITISQGRTFMVTNQRGEIEPGTAQGVYAIDTRFINSYKMEINHTPLQLINSSQLQFYSARFHLTNPVIPAENGSIAANTLHITLNRNIGEHIYETIDIANYTGKPAKFLFQLTLTSDFSDIFEVKSNAIVQRGHMITNWNQQQQALSTIYNNKGFVRAMTYYIQSNAPVRYANGQLHFDIFLEKGQHWQARCYMQLGPEEHDPPFTNEASFLHLLTSSHELPRFQRGTRKGIDDTQTRWQGRCPRLVSSNYEIARMYQQAIEDMGALRIYDMDVSENAWVPAAGVPWFVTLFGRDSLLVSLQNMSIAPEFARGALRRLADFQAKTVDDWRDAQPGKMLHEVRFGELATFHQIPFTPYYGTADATILYIIVLSEAYRWTGDTSLLSEFLETAERCLTWIDAYGDLDGDGFQEYQTFSPQGYENIGWKDAWDAVVYPDGTIVKQPKGLCELQGYVYDAKTRMAEIYRIQGNHIRAQQLQQEAQILKQRFNTFFWMEDEGCFAYGLDAQKKQIKTISSNAGHCLWSGIADPDKARRTAQRLMQKDMWSGWGIRTLTRHNPIYNPLSYQCGSVWPQDNAIIAAGFKRYGQINEALQVIEGIFDAILSFDAYRPPEVFAGVDRQKDEDFPILFPGGANIPQAWATGAIFQMINTLLGIKACVPEQRISLHPTLPPWLPDLHVKRLHIGSHVIDLHVWREGEQTRWEIERMEELTSERPASGPLTITQDETLYI